MTHIKTNYWAKPIPNRNFDWSAVDDDTYDGEGSPVGYGATEQEAIADLTEQLTEEGYIGGAEAQSAGGAKSCSQSK